MKIFTLIFCFAWLGAHAQPDIQWQKAFGGTFFEEANRVIQTSDGGYVVVGISSSNDGDIFGARGAFDYWVIKLSSSGALQWKKVFGGTGHDLPFDIDQTYDGGYVIAGYTNSDDCDVTGNHGGEFDAWLIKLSAQGVLQWQKALGGSDLEELPYPWEIQ